jgi:hypothetical protein
MAVHGRRLGDSGHSQQSGCTAGRQIMQNISNSDELTIENLDDSAFGITDVDGWCFILIDNTAR